MLAQDVWEREKYLHCGKDNEPLAFALDQRASGCTAQITFTPNTALKNRRTGWGSHISPLSRGTAVIAHPSPQSSHPSGLPAHPVRRPPAQASETAG